MKSVHEIDRGVCSCNYCNCDKLHATDWLQDIPPAEGRDYHIAEIRFKNTRKDFFENVNQLKLQPGDIVAVEANPGHDIGVVSITGELVLEQMKKYKGTSLNGELRKIYRLARQSDIDKWEEAISREHQTMIRSRQIAAELNLDMKIGDVEYQGDGTKAIFYYIADGRVDFRQLIRVLADTFRIRIEMKQIGARQEAGRIGGIGPCGRELCCATWITSFTSVTTSAARYQEISLNPQKLAGQCGKLKCCLNYEVDSYIDAQKNFPANHIPLETVAGTYYFLKSDIFRGVYWYTSKGDAPSAVIGLSVEKVKKIQQMNRAGKKPEKLMSEEQTPVIREEDSFLNMIGQDDINRFTTHKSSQKRRRKKPQVIKNPNNRTPGNPNRKPKKPIIKK